MHLKSTDDSIEYVEKLATDVLIVEFEDTNYTIEPSELCHIEELNEHPAGVSPAVISSALGLPVETFDGSPLYRGSEAGLELWYAVLDEDTDERFAVLSFGELQSGRYAYKLEAVLWPRGPGTD
ncbi:MULTISPECIES: hypothetical protein [unclassified Natrinema]|uniref:hypothetical protein n=1 Tax=unclassified Natrinema TaxID=2622230 RepID=UPI000677EFD0|nr:MULTISPECIES: hypothetical protein [unclassified Natrinema]